MVAVITPVMAGMRSGGGVKRSFQRRVLSPWAGDSSFFFSFFFFNKSWLDTSCEQSKTVQVAVDALLDAQNEPKEGGGGRETSLVNYGNDKYLEQKVQDVMVVMELGRPDLV